MNSFSFLSKSIFGCDAAFEEAEIAVFGAPFDGTVSFKPGSRFAPAAMRMDSYGIESYSPYQDADLCDIAACDMGDLDLPFGNTGAALLQVRETVSHILNAGKKPFMIGGEHLLTLPAAEACFKTYPDLQIIHLDAHADLRMDYIGEKLSHSTVMRRIWDFLGDNRIWQYGIRSGTREEFDFAKSGHVHFYPFDLAQLKKAAHTLTGKPVYLTIDLDVLDSSVLPGTGTPEAGGVTFKELMEALLDIKGLRIIGADMVELAPHYDSSGASTALACKLLRELLLLIHD